MRLFKSTGARFAQGRGGNIGRNGSVLEVRNITESGLVLYNPKTKREGLVAWNSLKNKSGRTMLAYGDALTINAAQSLTIRNGILSYPSGTQGTNGLDAYSAGTRQRERVDIVISEGAERREVRSLRPKNDDRIISRDDCWANVARDFANQPEKSLVVSFIDRGIRMRQGSATKLRQGMQPVEHRKAQGMAASRMPERRMKMHAERAAATMHQRMHEARELIVGVVQRMTRHKGYRPTPHPDISQAERDAARQHATDRARAPAQARTQQQSHGQDLEL